MNDDKENKPVLEKFTNVLKDAAHVVAEGAKAIVHPTAGTPMEMPLNESRYALTHLHLAPKAKRKIKTPAKKAANKSRAKVATKTKSSVGRKTVEKKKAPKKARKKTR